MMWYHQSGDIMNNDFVITSISRIIFVGKDEYKDPVLHFGSNLKYNELIYYLSGEAEIKFNGLSLKREKDSINFLPKGKTDEYIVFNREKSECIDIYFDTDVPVSDVAFVQKIQNNITVANLFKKAFSVWVAKNEGYYFECISLLYKIFAEMQKESYIPEKQYKAIKPAIDYIGENFLKNKITIAELTETCGISESYLNKLFIKKFGISPLKYIIQMKINYACDLLKSEEYSISQIAESCGYGNVYFFSRQFKEYVGISPTEFFKKYKSSK